MLDGDIKKFIKTAMPHLTWAMQSYLIMLLPELEIMVRKSSWEAMRIRRRLNDLAANLAGFDGVSVINGVTQVLKKFHPCYAGDIENDNEHIISDHAFCQGLRRYFGINLEDEKDKMLEVAKKQNWRFIGREQTIVTFLPMREAA